MVGRSIAAVVAGFLAVAGLSLATDQMFHVLEFYPPWGQPMYDTGHNLLALSYRVVYTVLGGFITARLAPRAPMRHVTILAIIGLIAGTAGAVAAITIGGLGPNWYPIAIAVTAYPCTWLGGGFCCLLGRLCGALGIWRRVVAVFSRCVSARALSVSVGRYALQCASQCAVLLGVAVAVSCRLPLTPAEFVPRRVRCLRVDDPTVTVVFDDVRHR